MNIILTIISVVPQSAGTTLVSCVMLLILSVHQTLITIWEWCIVFGIVGFTFAVTSSDCPHFVFKMVGIILACL